MKIIISTLALSIVLLTSCGTSNIKEPEYREISEIKLLEIGLLQSTAGIDLVYYNPNNFGVQLLLDGFLKHAPGPKGRNAVSIGDSGAQPSPAVARPRRPKTLHNRSNASPLRERRLHHMTCSGHARRRP